MFVSMPKPVFHELGRFYLTNSMFGRYSASSPESVTSIVWDYRGLDTLFETSVFFLAIIGGITVFRPGREREEKAKELKPISKPLPEPVRNVTKIVVAMILAVSASIALHGQLTPGGGFQGGSALAVAPLLLIAVYSKRVLEKNGLDKTRAIIIRSIGLFGIAALALIPLLFGYFVMQNRPFYPGWGLGVPLGGSLVYYNFFEFLAVGAGFTAVFLLLSIPESFYGGEEGA
ncbi:MAG: sodium:proton antiporter [Thermococci archaeon]|nr:sodium:proton antiporter [Thermococci archaeon]